ncbi:MAG: PqqD family peptide modification chaperone [bacterium]
MKKIKRNPEIVWRIEVEEEELLARAGKGEDISEDSMITLVIADMVHQLNYVAGKIWMLADGTVGENAIVSEILKNFDADEKTLRKDISFFLSRLLKEGWLILVDKKENML